MALKEKKITKMSRGKNATSTSALHDEKFERECQPLKDFENKESLSPKRTKKMTKAINTENLMINLARPLEYLESGVLGVIMRMIL